MVADLGNVQSERLPLAFHRQPHVLSAVSDRLTPRSARPHRILPGATAELEPALGCWSAYAAGGRTPAETVGFTLSTALQYAEDCIARGIDIDVLLRRFTFFFDISISFFEEIAKFRAARRIWARLARERLGAKNPNSWRFKFHGQTSGVDLTRQQPLNNIARVTTQAMAGILSGLQSMHTDAYDEAVATPTEETARIAVATQNILREEAHLCDVIDPLAGSYYVETLTDQMEAEILAVIAKIDAAGGMYKAAENGLVQTMIGESALRFQEKIERGEEKIIGVNCYQFADEEAAASRPNGPTSSA